MSPGAKPRRSQNPVAVPARQPQTAKLHVSLVAGPVFEQRPVWHPGPAARAKHMEQQDGTKAGQALTPSKQRVIFMPNATPHGQRRCKHADPTL